MSLTMKDLADLDPVTAVLLADGWHEVAICADGTTNSFDIVHECASWIENNTGTQIVCPVTSVLAVKTG